MSLGDVVGGLLNPPKAVAPPGVLSWENPDDGSLTLIEIDAVVEAAENLQSEITESAIADGSDTNDHIILKAPVLKLEIRQSEYPAHTANPFTLNGVELQDEELEVRQTLFEPSGLLFLLEGLEGAIGAIGDALFGGGAATLKYSAFKIKNPSLRIRDLQVELFQRWQEKRLLTVAIEGRVYRGYAIQGVGSVRSGEDQLGAFTLELKKIRTSTVGVSNLPDPSQLRDEANKGQTPPVTVQEAEDTAVKSSVMFQGLDALGLF